MSIWEKIETVIFRLFVTFLFFRFCQLFLVHDEDNTNILIGVMGVIFLMLAWVFKPTETLLKKPED